MEGKKKNIIIGVIVSLVVVLFIIFGTLACLGIFREFDAQRYVTAILDQTLKGDVEDAAQMTEGTTEEVLYAQYEAGMKSFVKSIFPSDAELSSELEEQYTEICKKIFCSFKYEVQEAEKVSDKEYHVPVKYQPTDIFEKFETSVVEESQRLNEMANNGEKYRGNLDETMAQIKEDVLNNSCALLEEAYNNMQFGEEQTMVLTVKKGESGLYELETGAITEFLKKILSIDEIQH